MLVHAAARGIPLYGPSGASAHVRGIVRALLSLGHEVRVATPLAADARGAWDASPPLPSVHAPPLPWPRGLRTLGARVDGHRLARAALACAPDLVWERHDPASAAVRRRARATRLVEVDAPLAWERTWPRRPAESALRREAAAVRSADRVVAVSAWLAGYARELGCADVLHVPNGVEPQEPGDRDGARARLGLRGPVVGFLGTCKRWHGADRLPAILDALGPEWTALVVGDGPCAPGPHPRILRTGQVEPRVVPDLVAAMDVGLAPYRRDAPPWFCPLKVFAYRAQGVPVVAADVGDCRRFAGRVVAGDRPQAWAEAARDALGVPRVRWVRTWTDVAREALGG